MAEEETSKPKYEITIYAMPGSQFTAKVLAALDARKVPHYCVFVPMQLEPRKKFLPSGGTMVPELKAVPTEGGGEPSVVPDSEAILHWLDDHLDTKLFPTAEASELSVRASEKTLTGAAWYFNWNDPQGYANSMQKTMVRALLPSFLPTVVGNWIVDKFLVSTRAKFKAQAQAAMGVDEAAMEDRDKIRQILVDELTYFQTLLKEDQPYLLGQGEPTAGDFSVYAQVERLVGDMGDSNVSCSMPELKEETSKELETFWKWHQNMRDNHPLKFKGKRPPKKE